MIYDLQQEQQQPDSWPTAAGTKGPPGTSVREHGLSSKKLCYVSAAKIGLLKQKCSGLRFLDSVDNEWSLVGLGGLLDEAFMLLIVLWPCPDDDVQ
ncbi:hypothetical protein Nepgr_014732 [Nepenthes gracilis]|uniref:Uncharacterized protein n=1 Tax=Nepenthes gracilis TaxID=150966 RepID=A0AAD3SLR3_NEPGR|nr:hypothetical protein Nepgr_014732 [Nepenthes gracilis]